MTLYPYLLPNRPVGPGTVPKGFYDFENYPERMMVCGHMVWGEVRYDHPLTEKEIGDYELIDIFHST